MLGCQIFLPTINATVFKRNSNSNFLDSIVTTNEKAQSGGAIRFLHNSSRLSDLLHFIFRREKKWKKRKIKKEIKLDKSKSGGM